MLRCKGIGRSERFQDSAGRKVATGRFTGIEESSGSPCRTGGLHSEWAADGPRMLDVREQKEAL